MRGGTADRIARIAGETECRKVGGDCRCGAQKARQRIHPKLGDEIGCRSLADRRHRKTAGQVDRRPKRRESLVEAADRGLVGEIDASCDIDAGIRCVRKILEFGGHPG